MAPDDKGEDPLIGHERYVSIRHLGRGAYGHVILALDQQTGKKVAIKFIDRTSPGNISKYVEREILNHSMLVHPHVIRFIEVFLTKDYLAIAMEYAAGGDLHRLVSSSGGLDEDRCRWFYQQLILALDYCHKKGISNRDIKLENTLLDSDDATRRPLLKICDFGYSINEDKSNAKTVCGTPGYAAPEVLDRFRGGTRPYNGKLADVWSSGVMLYVMLFCAYPFERPDDDPKDKKHNAAVLQRVLKGEYYIPPKVRVSPEVLDLLSRTFQVDPTLRITLPQIWEHPWVRKGLPPSLDVDSFNAEYVRLTTPEVLKERGTAVLEVVNYARADAQRRVQEADEFHMYDELAADTNFSY
eukprot:jgi/Botrbrau1/2156/Bobra.0093s0057.1